MRVWSISDADHPEEAPDNRQTTVEVEHPLPSQGAGNHARAGDGNDGAEGCTCIGGIKPIQDFVLLCLMHVFELSWAKSHVFIKDCMH